MKTQYDWHNALYTVKIEESMKAEKGIDPGEDLHNDWNNTRGTVKVKTGIDDRKHTNSAKYSILEQNASDKKNYFHGRRFQA